MQNPKKYGRLKKLFSLIDYIKTRYTSLTGKVYEHAIKMELKREGFDCHDTSKIIGKLTPENFKCGSHVYLGVYSILFIGNDSRGGAGFGNVKIGNDVYIGDHCNIRAAGGTISIGSKVLFGNHVTAIAANHGYLIGTPIADQPWNTNPTGVSIGDDCWIGAHVTLLPGTQIQPGSIVAAGAVVNCEIPSNEIWGGVPAKKIGMRPHQLRAE